MVTLLGVVHKLHLQEEGAGNSKMLIFVNVHKIENVKGGREVVKKWQKCVNVVCEQFLIQKSPFQ